MPSPQRDQQHAVNQPISVKPGEHHALQENGGSSAPTPSTKPTPPRTPDCTASAQSGAWPGVLAITVGYCPFGNSGSTSSVQSGARGERWYRHLVSAANSTE